MNRENNNTIVLFGGNMSEFRKSVSLVSNTCFSLLASGANSLFTIPFGTYLPEILLSLKTLKLDVFIEQKPGAQRNVLP
jgi:hypothetical protein